jgi:hypothetical protein
MISPAIDVQEVRTSDDGDLPKGMYFYSLVGINSIGEKSFVNTLQVYVGYKGNSIHIFWNPVKGMSEYRLYRGTCFGLFDGYFSVYGDDGYFCDDGTGILNIENSVLCH